MQRRNFFKTAGLTVAAGSIAPLNLTAGNEKNVNPRKNLYIGLASYSTRKYSLEDTLKMCKRLQLQHISLKSFHLPMDASKKKCEETANKIKDAGIEFVGAGVIYMKNKEQVDQAFTYAKNAGIKTIVGVPSHDLLDYTEEKIKEFDICVAIHNHGPGDKVYPTCEVAYDKIKDRDRRFGLCMDIGHTRRLNYDPAEVFEDCFDRILDIHIKDVSDSTKAGHGCEIGRGVINIPFFLKTVLNSGYSGTVSYEYEKDPEDIMPGLAESVGYVNGVLASV